MDIKAKIANRKEILKAARKDLADLRDKEASSRRELLAVMTSVHDDPARAHLYYSQVGLLYIEQERFRLRGYLAEGSCLTLRQEIANLQKQLANE